MSGILIASCAPSGILISYPKSFRDWKVDYIFVLLAANYPSTFLGPLAILIQRNHCAESDRSLNHGVYKRCQRSVFEGLTRVGATECFIGLVQ